MADLTALDGPWRWLMDVVGPGIASGPGPAIDDDLAYVSPWGFDPAEVTAPALFLHGQRDRVAPPGHGRWLADRCPRAQLWLYPQDGHISVLTHAEDALTWLADRSRLGPTSDAAGSA